MPVVDLLQKRYRSSCYLDNGVEYCPSNSWNNWVRWVVLVIIVVAFFLLFVFCSCLTARRRRRQGRNPIYGTGWASRHGQPQYVGGNNPPAVPPHPMPGYNAQPYYNPGAPQYNAPAPPYSPPAGGYYANANHQQSGYEMGAVPNEPQPAYTHAPRNDVAGGADVYEPPVGPPPGKPGKHTDGVVR